MFQNSHTRAASPEPSRSVASFDLGTAHPDHVIEIQTVRTAYRLARRSDTYLTADLMKNVSMTANRRGRDERTSVDVDRVVFLGRRHPYGRDGEMSAVRAVFVGGVKVLG